jgi:hypothetical protein
MSKIATIYSLTDPKTQKIHYIGSTIHHLQVRLYQHSVNSKSCKTARDKWIKVLADQDLLPIIEELDVVGEAGRYEAETYWIQQFRVWGFELLNSGNTAYNIGKRRPNLRPKKVKELRTRKARKIYRPDDTLLQYLTD